MFLPENPMDSDDF